MSRDFVIIEEIFRINHDNSNVKHFSLTRTKIDIRNKYYWFDMINDIKKYCKICLNFQRVRVYHHKLYENLISISSKDCESFTTITFNFITNRFSIKNSYTKKINDAILMLINKLIKHVIYIATIKNFNVQNFANVLWREFVCHYNIMRELIFDRESLFINHFWTIFCWHLRAKRKLSTTFHS